MPLHVVAVFQNIRVKPVRDTLDKDCQHHGHCCYCMQYTLLPRPTTTFGYNTLHFSTIIQSELVLTPLAPPAPSAQLVKAFLVNNSVLKSSFLARVRNKRWKTNEPPSPQQLQSSVSSGDRVEPHPRANTPQVLHLRRETEAIHDTSYTLRLVVLNDHHVAPASRRQQLLRADGTQQRH